MSKGLDRGLTPWMQAAAWLTVLIALGTCSVGACSVDDLVAAGRPCSATAPCGPGLSCSSGICTSHPVDAALPDRGTPVDAPTTVDRPPAGEQISHDLPAPDAFVRPGTWVKLPAGSFLMGSPVNETCREMGKIIKLKETQHSVTLTRPFEIMDNEVSEGQFEQVMGYNTAALRSGSIWPYNGASWHEAAAFCDRLSDLAGLPRCYAYLGSAKPCSSSTMCPKDEVCISPSCRRLEAAAGYTGGKIYGCSGFRLPTEAEWEYAYRAGSTSSYYSGEGVTAVSCGDCFAVDPSVDKIGWYCANITKLKAPPLTNTTKLPNAWTLRNMAGSLEEWCHDGTTTDLGAAAVVDPVVTHTTGSLRITRGGNFSAYKHMLRGAARSANSSTYRSNKIGFRCVRSLSSPDAGP